MGILALIFLYLFVRIVRRVFRRKNPLAKADKAMKKGDFARALALYKEHGRYLKAAQAAASMGDMGAAADLFKKGKDFLSAAKYYLLGNRFSEAALIYEESGKKRDAAIAWERAGDVKKALALYLDLKVDAKVEKILSEMDDYEHLGKYYEERAADKVREMGGVVPEGTEEASVISSLYSKSGESYLKASMPLKAVEMFERAGMLHRIAEIYEKTGNLVEASHYYQSAGNIDKAVEMLIALEGYDEAIELLLANDKEEEVIRVLEMAGRTKEASERRAKLEIERGKVREAAQDFERAGHYSKAAELYLQMKDFVMAGRMFELGGEYEKAAEIYVEQGMLKEAGAAYEKAGKFLLSGKCFRDAGMMDKAVAVLEGGGDLFAAARLHEEEGNEDAAVAAYQKIDRSHPDYRKAAGRLARIFLGRNMLSLAHQKVLEAIGKDPPSRDNLADYETLGLIFERAGKHKEAVAVYEKILLVDLNYSDIEERRKKLLAHDLYRAGKEAVTASKKGPAGVDFFKQGSVIDDRYEILSEIGRGGMGFVYLALDKGLDRKVALKVLSPYLVEDKTSVEMFLAEAKTAASLSHPNIVTIHDVGHWKGFYYIVMEYVDGANIKDMLREMKRLPVRSALLVANQVCSGLSCAHRAGVCHLDIKNSNLIWSNDRIVKIADFGMSALAKVKGTAKGDNLQAGSPAYMSPEQILGKNIDHRSDIYSLGVSIFEMLTGRYPFPSEGDPAYHHVHTPPVALREFLPEAPLLLEEAVMRCLKKDPAERYGSAEELASAIEKAAAETER